MNNVPNECHCMFRKPVRIKKNSNLTHSHWQWLKLVCSYWLQPDWINTFKPYLRSILSRLFTVMHVNYPPKLIRKHISKCSFLQPVPHIVCPSTHFSICLQVCLLEPSPFVPSVCETARSEPFLDVICRYVQVPQSGEQKKGQAHSITVDNSWLFKSASDARY